ncbi:carbonic anhydrase [Desulfobacterota bacterium AH_259_B03_O07]|nr:carbonic anhydrase [Desulfobacterota bacterium AH_259_B03_O07]
MADLQNLIERNRQFADQYEGNLSIIPRFSTMVFTCVDARIDPAHFLGLGLGDALVFRNAGARVTNDVELELGILWTLASRLSGGALPSLALAIIQHTDCGYERLANPELQQALSRNLGVDKAEFGALANADHPETIRKDIERLHRSPLVPNELVVSGHLYNVTDGLLQEVVAPAPLQSGT